MALTACTSGILLQLFVQWHAGVGGHQIVDLGPRHTQIEVLKYGVVAVGDAVDADHGHVASTGVVPGEFAEGTFDFTLASLDDPFDDDLRTPRHRQPV